MLLVPGRGSAVTLTRDGGRADIARWRRRSARSGGLGGAGAARHAHLRSPLLGPETAREADRRIARSRHSDPPREWSRAGGDLLAGREPAAWPRCRTGGRDRHGGTPGDMAARALPAGREPVGETTAH